MEIKQPVVYILANKFHGTLYVGVTSNLLDRVRKHKEGVALGFSNKYGCDKLVYYEFFDCMDDAINREQQLKSGSRKKKIILIELENPMWWDLYGM